MQIIQQTATVLEFRNEDSQSRRRELTGGLPVFLLFSLSFLLGGLASILQSEQAKLTCNRLEPNHVSCQLTTSSLLQQDQTPQAIGQLQSAELATQHEHDSSSYQVMLVTPTGKIPLTQTFTSGVRVKQQRVDKINLFLTDSVESSLTIQQNDGWIFYPVGGLFMFLGGGLLTMVFTSEVQVSCTFDRRTKQMILEKQSLLAKIVQEVSFSDIKGAEVLTVTDDEGQILPYAVQLVFSLGKKIRLQLLVPKNELHSIAKSINQMLDPKA